MQKLGCDGDAGRLSLTPEQTDKFVELVAAGEAELPDGLPREQETVLIRRVRSRLHDRLVDLIARQIAIDIESGPGEMKE